MPRRVFSLFRKERSHEKIINCFTGHGICIFACSLWQRRQHGGDKDGDSGKDKKAERVTTASGAISVEALDMPDYITKAEDDDEDILMAKEGEGYGVGDYVLISRHFQGR